MDLGYGYYSGLTMEVRGRVLIVRGVDSALNSQCEGMVLIFMENRVNVTLDSNGM